MALKQMNLRLDIYTFFVKIWFFKGFGATSRSRLWEYRSKHKKELDVIIHGVIEVFFNVV